MRAIVCHRLSDDRSGLRFEPDWPDPLPPAPDEVMVALTHAALNFPDVLMLAGGYQYAPPLPFIPGIEGAGRVIAVGPDTDPALVGCEVMVGTRSGLLAERITVPRTAVRKTPPGLDLAHAAAFTVAALTAYAALVCRGRTRPGDRVVITGAGGGTGLAAVALARTLGAQPIAIASTQAKLDAARAAGAVAAFRVDRGSNDLALSDIDVVFDPVGGALALPLLSALRPGGRYLIVGFTAGIVCLSFDRLSHGVEVVGVRAGEMARRDPAIGVANLNAIDVMAAQLRPTIGLRVALEQAAVAFDAMAAGTLIGKAVIDCA